MWRSWKERKEQKEARTDGRREGGGGEKRRGITKEKQGGDRK